MATPIENVCSDLLKQISLSGHRVDNGADYVQCPCCHAIMDVQGFVGNYGNDITMIEHNEDCALYKLWEMFGD
jgi:hypothetical protein